MAETHELRLKIDAAAAKRGASEFKGAMDSVRRAVRNLEKDTTGAFTTLRRVDTSGLREFTREAQNTAKSVDVTARASDRAAENIRKLAIQSANSLRVSTDQASRLRDRLLSVGDTQGLAKLEAGLAHLRTSLTNATSGLDVREARAAYADLASELNRTSRASAPSPSQPRGQRKQQLPPQTTVPPPCHVSAPPTTPSIETVSAMNRPCARFSSLKTPGL